MGYSVTVNVYRGTPGIGHASITLTDAAGNSITVGYYPGENEGTPYEFSSDVLEVPSTEDALYVYSGPNGEVRDERRRGEEPIWSNTTSVSEDQYNAMYQHIQDVINNPGTYNLFQNGGENCAGFVSGILDAGNITGYPHPVHPYGFIDDASIPASSLYGALILEQSVLDFEDAEGATPPPPPRRDPLTLDLDGDGIETIGVNTGAYFDHDGNGFAEQTGWVGADDGLLVWDRNGDGRINDGGELFGDQTRLQDGSLATNGFQALAEWDENADGKIDSNDAVWANIKVWQDADGDGYSSASELKNLSDFNITGINLNYTAVSTPDGQGNTQVQSGSFTKADGSTGAIGGFQFNRDTLYTIQEDYLTVTPDIASLPDLRGYGNVYDLQQAIVRDSTGSLKALVESFVAEQNPGTRNTLLEQILFKWTGSDAIDPASRGGSFDARKLSVLEKFYGRDFVGTSGPNPITQAVPLLTESYQGLSEMLYAQLAAQTHLKSLYDLIAYSWDTTTQSIRGDLTAVVSAIQTQLAADSDAGMFALAEFARTVKGLQAETTLDYTAFRGTFATQDSFLGSVIDSTSSATVYGTASIDMLSADSGNNLILAGAGDDTVNIGGSNTVTAGEGADNVFVSYSSTNNTVDGGAGDDWLHVEQGATSHAEYTYTYNVANIFTGGTGNDILEGSAGAETYRFARGDGLDTIRDNPRGYGPTRADRVEFGAGVNPLDLVFSRSGNNLVMATHGTTDSVTIESWYAGSQYQIETMRAGDNSTLVNSQVEQLIQAMATFSAQNGGITWDQAIDQRPDDVQAILAANWMPAA